MAAAASGRGLRAWLLVVKTDSTMRGNTTQCNARRCDANDRRTSVDVDQGGAAGGGQRGGVLAGVELGVGGRRRDSTRVLVWLGAARYG